MCSGPGIGFTDAGCDLQNELTASCYVWTRSSLTDRAERVTTMSLTAAAENNNVASNPLVPVAARLGKKISCRLAQGPYAVMCRYGLRRDLTQPQAVPKPRIPIEIRQLAEADLEVLLSHESVDSAKERTEMTWRRDFYSRFPHGCFVAVDLRTGVPCYMQWLLGPADNAALAALRCFPALGEDEALLEQAYTHPDYRGRYIMPAAMAMIADRAVDIGARYVLTFVEESNVPSLKGCQRAGFRPHMLHRRAQYAFGSIVCNRFVSFAADDPRRTMHF